MKLQTIVFDTSTLILLAKTDLLQGVVEKFRVVIPRQVSQEACAKPQLYDAQLIDQILKDNKIEVSDDSAAPNTKLIQQQFKVHAGEAAALYLAHKNGWPIGIDDGPGIRAAKILGLHFLTALHFVIGFYENQFIDQQTAQLKLQLLEKWGRYHIQIITEAHSKILKAR